MKRSEVIEVMKLALSPWPHLELSEHLTDVAEMIFEEIEYQEARTSTASLLKSARKFAPTPGEIAEAVRIERKRNQPRTQVEELPEVPKNREPLDLWGQVEAKRKH